MLMQLKLAFIKLVRGVALICKFPMEFEKFRCHVLYLNPINFTWLNCLSPKWLRVSYLFGSFSLRYFNIGRRRVVLSQLRVKLGVIHEWRWCGELPIGDFLRDHMNMRPAFAGERVSAPPKDTLN